MDPAVAAPAVAGTPRMLLRLEAFVVFALSVAMYGRLGESWWLFAALFLVPDLCFLAYLAGPRAGAVAYNAVHTSAGPVLLALTGLLAPYQPAVAIGLIWLSHCGLDRALGYGLKYEAGFAYTHLGIIGRAAPPLTGVSGDPDLL